MSFLEVLLGDSPALTPEELFYQRLLAMDPDEARNVAEEYLEDKSLEQLYESVLIPALRLAEEDRHTDILGDRSSEFISQSTRELIDDLDDRDKRQASPAEAAANGGSPNARFANARIVCLPARDDADELVGMMLAQLLRRAGNQQRSISGHRHSRQHVGRGSPGEVSNRLYIGASALSPLDKLAPFASAYALDFLTWLSSLDCGDLQAGFPRPNSGLARDALMRSRQRSRRLCFTSEDCFKSIPLISLSGWKSCLPRIPMRIRARNRLESRQGNSKFSSTKQSPISYPLSHL